MDLPYPFICQVFKLVSVGKYGMHNIQNQKYFYLRQDKFSNNAKKTQFSLYKLGVLFWFT